MKARTRPAVGPFVQLLLCFVCSANVFWPLAVTAQEPVSESACYQLADDESLLHAQQKALALARAKLLAKAVQGAGGGRLGLSNERITKQEVRIRQVCVWITATVSEVGGAVVQPPPPSRIVEAGSAPPVSPPRKRGCGDPSDPADFIEGNYWAFIMGINTYPTMDKDKQLTAARKDAQAVANVLIERYGFWKECMIELYDEAATRKGIIRAFSSLRRRLTNKDSLFIYYAGRGAYEKRGQQGAGKDDIGYWVPSDAELDDPASYVFTAQVLEYLKAIPARHIYLVVDSAFNSPMEGKPEAPRTGTVQELYGSRSRSVLMSGALNPTVADASKNGHSTFAWHFMNVLKQNTNPYLLARDIVEPLATQVTQESSGQPPRITSALGPGDEGGQFVFRLKKEESKSSGVTVPPGDRSAIENDSERSTASKQQEEERLKAEIKAVEERAKRDAEERQARMKAAKEREEKRLGTQMAKTAPLVEATLRPFSTPQAKDAAPIALIPAGEFLMGSKIGDGHPDESPQRSVYLDAYTMDRYEVTVEQYAAYLKASRAERPDFWERVDQTRDAHRPVVGVDWLDANDYCEFHGKRLPTEAQWEKAARGTDGRKYPWGADDPGPDYANFASGVSFSYGKSLTIVGSYEAGKSPYGLYDMVGNVWEWVLDWYNKDYYQSAPLKNPAGPASGDYRVIRGGSWSKRPATARVAGRMYLSPAQRSNSVGFRCAGPAQISETSRTPVDGTDIKVLEGQMIAVLVMALFERGSQDCDAIIPGFKASFDNFYAAWRQKHSREIPPDNVVTFAKSQPDFQKAVEREWGKEFNGKSDSEKKDRCGKLLFNVSELDRIPKP